MTRADILARYTPAEIEKFGSTPGEWKGGLTPFHLCHGYIVCPWCGHDLNPRSAGCGDDQCCSGCWVCDCMASVRSHVRGSGSIYRVYAEDDFEEVGADLFMPKLLKEVDAYGDEAEKAWAALCRVNT